MISSAHMSDLGDKIVFWSAVAIFIFLIGG